MKSPAYFTVRADRLDPWFCETALDYLFPEELGILDLEGHAISLDAFLVGMESGCHETIRLTFIDDYHAAEFALRYA